MAEDEGKARLGTQVSEPIPGEETCNRDDEGTTRRRNGREQRLRAGLHVLVPHALAVLVEETAVHGAGMQGDAAVRLVLCGGESPEVSSSAW